MADYLRAECTKAFRRKYLYIALLVCLAGESLLLLGSWLTYSWGNTNISFHSTAVMVAAILSFGLYATLITGDIVFSDQYKHNTLKNEVSYGLPRGRIYLGKLLVSMLVALAACVVLIGFYLGGCWLLFPHDGSDGTVWSLLGYCLAGRPGPGDGLLFPGTQQYHGRLPVDRYPGGPGQCVSGAGAADQPGL